MKTELTNSVKQKQTLPACFQLNELSRDRMEVNLGPVSISVVTAKEPHRPWDPELKEQVLSARRSYWKLWGMVPLEDNLDESSYVDVAWVYSHGQEGSELSLEEGLTMRTVLINGRNYDNYEKLPDDLRFFSDLNNVPLLDLLSEKFYKKNKRLTKEKIVAAARIAPIRLLDKDHNSFTAEAFAAIQVMAAFRAMEDGVELFVNTMRPEMDTNILALANGVSYSHKRTEDALGLDRGSIRLNRKDPFVQEHIFSYLGYFTETRSFIELIEELMDPNDARLDINTLKTINIDPQKVSCLKASQLRSFIPLILQKGPINSRFTGEEFRELITDKVKDGPASYTMTTEERFNSGMQVLTKSSLLYSLKRRKS